MGSIGTMLLLESAEETVAVLQESLKESAWGYRFGDTIQIDLGHQRLHVPMPPEPPWRWTEEYIRYLTVLIKANM